MAPIYTILLLLAFNTFMTLAWYGHLSQKFNFLNNQPLWVIVLFSWVIAFMEYCLMVPANRIGSSEFGGPFNIIQLKIIQEIIGLTVFTGFVLFFFKEVKLNWNHLIAFIFIILAVYFVFKGNGKQA